MEGFVKHPVRSVSRSYRLYQKKKKDSIENRNLAVHNFTNCTAPLRDISKNLYRLLCATVRVRIANQYSLLDVCRICLMKNCQLKVTYDPKSACRESVDRRFCSEEESAVI